MAYRKKAQKHLCFAVILLEAAALAGVVFTDTNAAGNNQHRGEGLEGLATVNFADIRLAPRPWDKQGWFRNVQAEILVPSLSLDLVQYFGFISPASLAEGERLWGEDVPHPPFQLDERLFKNHPNEALTAVHFPFVRSILLTSDEISEGNVREPRANTSIFKRTATGTVTAVISLQAPASSRAEAIWHPTELKSEASFDHASQWFHWPSASMQLLPDGPCKFEYRMNGVRWVTVPFEVHS